MTEVQLSCRNYVRQRVGRFLHRSAIVAVGPVIAALLVYGWQSYEQRRAIHRHVCADLRIVAADETVRLERFRPIAEHVQVADPLSPDSPYHDRGYPAPLLDMRTLDQALPGTFGLIGDARAVEAAIEAYAAARRAREHLGAMLSSIVFGAKGTRPKEEGASYLREALRVAPLTEAARRVLDCGSI